MTENLILLSSGRKIKIQNGTVHINCFLETGHGYGTPLLRYDPDSGRDAQVDPVLNAHSLTNDEAIELCECVATLWMKLKDNIVKHGVASDKIFIR